GPSGAETTRLPAAPVNGRPTDGWGGPEGGDRRDHPAEPSNRAWSRAGDDGTDDAPRDAGSDVPGGGSHRREDKDPDWQPPWERED
ncbi:hypothetical protein G6030_14900, partial [Dietzia sp. E1]|uniref:hypothetical protein n=1 Tax=Dietzia sp. E1 TaxID=328361 RepID=UPI0019D613F4